MEIRRLVGRGVAVSCLIASIGGCGGGASAVSLTAAPRPAARPGLAGRNFYATWDNGRKFLLEFTADGKKQRYTGLVGRSNNETVDIETVVVAPDVYMVNWIESDGFTVTRIDDIGAMTSRAYWTWDEKGKRTGQLHSGKLEATDMTRERLFRENPSLQFNPPEPPR